MLLIGAMAYLVYAGVEQGSVYYFQVDEFMSRRDTIADQGVRVAGRVAQGAIVKQMTPSGTELHFALGHFQGDALVADQILNVHFTGIVPDMFGEGRDVIVEGKYHDGTLEAHTLMTSCPSKYEAGGSEGEAAATTAS